MPNNITPKNHLFESIEIRSSWDAEAEKWWFSALDVVSRSHTGAWNE
jgi:hypothetical protein